MTAECGRNAQTPRALRCICPTALPQLALVPRVHHCSRPTALPQLALLCTAVVSDACCVKVGAPHPSLVELINHLSTQMHAAPPRPTETPAPTAKTEVETLRKQLAKATTSDAAVKAEVETLRKQLAKATTSDAATKREVETLRKQLEAGNDCSSTTKLEGKLNQLSKSLLQSNLELETERKSAFAQAGKLGTALGKISQLENELSFSRAAADQAATSASQHALQLAELESDLISSGSRNLQLELDSRARALTDATAAAEARGAEEAASDGLKEQLAESQQRVAQLESEKSLVSPVRADMQMALEVRHELVTDLQQQLRATRRELAESRAAQLKAPKPVPKSQLSAAEPCKSSVAAASELAEEELKELKEQQIPEKPPTICVKCASKLTKDAKFCRNCGKQVGLNKKSFPALSDKMPKKVVNHLVEVFKKAQLEGCMLKKANSALRRWWGQMTATNHAGQAVRAWCGTATSSANGSEKIQKTLQRVLLIQEASDCRRRIYGWSAECKLGRLRQSVVMRNIANMLRRMLISDFSSLVGLWSQNTSHAKQVSEEQRLMLLVWQESTRRQQSVLLNQWNKRMIAARIIQLDLHPEQQFQAHSSHHSSHMLTIDSSDSNDHTTAASHMLMIDSSHSNDHTAAAATAAARILRRVITQAAAKQAAELVSIWRSRMNYLRDKMSQVMGRWGNYRDAISTQTAHLLAIWHKAVLKVKCDKVDFLKKKLKDLERRLKGASIDSTVVKGLEPHHPIHILLLVLLDPQLRVSWMPSALSFVS